LSHLISRIERMFGELNQAMGLLEQAVRKLDPDTLEPRFAFDLVRIFSKAEKLAGAGKALAARRVAQSGSWQGEGDRSAAHFLARTTGDSVSASVTAIETAGRMGELSSAEEAFRSGRLSAAQAAEIASASSVAPRAEKALLEVAENEGIEKLRQVCREVVARHSKDELERAERLYRSRYLRTWTDPEGSFRMDARLTPEAGAAGALGAGRAEGGTVSAGAPSGKKGALPGARGGRLGGDGESGKGRIRAGGAEGGGEPNRRSPCAGEGSRPGRRGV